MVTTQPANILGLKGYGIAEGNKANLLLVFATNAHDLLRRQPKAEMVITQGEILETAPTKTIFHQNRNQVREEV
ncbi:hypothetical protein [Alkalihalobacillus deserti]|uniref:hypothetical protein n=1 Tax=Alkalihalobacillus deserti TaxID=2879466 RepID=UPI001D14D471|nr:hypothetical protein [Alkalihalobacillus deserti]